MLKSRYLPSGHEGKHDERVAKTVVILEPCAGIGTLFGEAKYLHQQYRKKDEERCPEQEEVANSR